MDIIVVVDENFGIGKENNLLARLPADMKRFRELTTGNTVVMGSKTYLSFPKRPLPDRKNIVITRSPDKFPDVICFKSIDEFLSYADNSDEQIFVCGGGEIYKQLLPYCDKAYVTKIHETFEPDTYFPNLDNDDRWKIEEESEPIETNGHMISFVLYHNTK